MVTRGTRVTVGVYGGSIVSSSIIKTLWCRVGGFADTFYDCLDNSTTDDVFEITDISRAGVNSYTCCIRSGFTDYISSVALRAVISAGLFEVFFAVANRDIAAKIDGFFRSVYAVLVASEVNGHTVLFTGNALLDLTSHSLSLLTVVVTEGYWGVTRIAL